jgi:hypothetical protein
MGAGVVELQHADFGEGQVVVGGGDADELSGVVCVGAKDETPVDVGVRVGRLKAPARAGRRASESRCTAQGLMWVGGKECIIRGLDLHVRRSQFDVVVECENKGFGKFEGAVRYGVVHAKAGEAPMADMHGKRERTRPQDTCLSF